MPIPISRIIRKFSKIFKILSAFPQLTDNEREMLVNILANSKTGAPPELKLKIYHTLKRLKKRKKRPFGMLIVLGWQREWNKKYASIPDKTQNLFAEKPFDFANSSDERALEILSRLADFDGAILMTEKGEIIASGIYLEGMQTKRLFGIVSQDSHQDMSAALGFAKKVHTRHMAGITASYLLRGTTVFVVSEEDGSIRIFENGKIIFSTINKEMHNK